MSFGLDNLPYGVFSVDGGPPRVGVRYGDQVVDLAPLLGDDVFREPNLNPFMARGRGAWRATRGRVQDLLADDRGAGHLIPLDRVRLHLPIDVADYVDFYASLEHASNLGRMFRPDEEPLKPNWRHLPVGYHGRAGTVVVSGTDIRRPCGQRPSFGPSAKLDIEAEVGFVVGAGTELCQRAGAFDEHVFGVVLVNDWSARDIQAWEYVPLGPFLGKSFATSISAWVTPLDALDHARVGGREQDPAPLDYLRRNAEWGLDLALEVRLNDEVVSTPPYRDMYWTPDQMLAHLTVNGASLRTGDLYASGTVSGEDSPGSFIELTWNGTRPMKSGQSFLEDGDTVTITATTPSGLSLGEVTGRILPATVR
uniref:fumarylacetoacetate hydrolase family protein n=1 Tax=Herbidospora sakaeratensis TaxID=564415 RepID=UPI00078232E3|nr:fumarylacetoacetate hydrolase family protein [Herbidospora sakaeratensis]